MYPSRLPSNPDGPDKMYHVGTRISSRTKYTGPDKNIYGVDVKSTLGKAFFQSENIEILRSDLYSQAVTKLKGVIPRANVPWPEDTLIYKKCHELYPIYAPIVHSLDVTTLPSQVSQLNRTLVERILPSYLAQIKGNRYYIDRLNKVPSRAELPSYIEGASHKELLNRSFRMSASTAASATTNFKQSQVGSDKDQTGFIVHPIPHNPWLSTQMPHMYALAASAVAAEPRMPEKAMTPTWSL